MKKYEFSDIKIINGKEIVFSEKKNYRDFHALETRLRELGFTTCDLG